MRKDDFGVLLRSFRICRKMSQPQLAGHIGKSQSTIAKYESGKSGPPDCRITRIICDVLELTDEEADTLLITAGCPSLTQIDLQLDSVRELHQLLHSHNVSPEVKHMLDGAVSSIVAACKTLGENDLASRTRHTSEIMKTTNALRNNLKKQLTQVISRLTIIEANAALHQNKPDVALMLLQRTSITESASDVSGIGLYAKLLILEGDVKKQQGEWNEASKKYLDANRRFDRIGDHVNLARTQRKMASIDLLQGDCLTAERYLQDSANLLQQRDQYEFARTCVDLCWLYSIQGQLEQAYEWINKGFSIAEYIENKYLQMLSKSGKGHLYRQMRLWEDAKEEFSAALKDAVELEDLREQGWIKLGIGRVEYFISIHYLQQGNKAEAALLIDRAFKNLREAEGLFFQTQYHYRYELALALIGKLLLDAHVKDCLTSQITTYTQDLICSHHETDTQYTLTDVFGLVKTLYENALSGFSKMKSGYYICKVLEQLCELVCYTIDPYSLSDIELERANYDAAHYVSHIVELHDDSKYPQHLARAKAHQGVVALKSRCLEFAVEHFTSAFCWANYYNIFVLEEIEQYFDEVIRIIPQLQDISPADIRFLSLPPKSVGVDVASAFCRKVSEAISIEWKSYIVDDTPKKRQRIHLLAEGLNKKARDIEMHRYSLFRAIRSS